MLLVLYVLHSEYIPRVPWERVNLTFERRESSRLQLPRKVISKEIEQ